VAASIAARLVEYRALSTTDFPLEPMLFDRLLKEKVWGGRELVQRFALQPEFAGPLGETWELSDYPGEETTVRGGHHAGKSLRSLMEEAPAAMLGSSQPTADGRFPLLVKFLDAADDLSVQIHPPDGPLSPTGVGKTEAWYILDSKPGSAVICGLRPGTKPETFRAEAGDARVREHLAEIPVAAGDCLLVPAGQTHAIRGGVVLCEIQQTSDVTYRMYDWDRLGLDGQARETHLQQALEVVDYELPPAIPYRATFGRAHTDGGLQNSVLVSCPYFRLEELRVGGVGGDLFGNDLAQVLVVLGGHGEISALGGHAETRALQPGDSMLLPGGLGGVRLAASDHHEPLSLLLGVAL